MVLKRFPLPRIIDRPPREVTVAATQMSLTWDLEGNMKKAEDLVRKAASQGAQIILIQVLV
jgi:N-carbamoylputrescine amidase